MSLPSLPFPEGDVGCEPGRGSSPSSDQRVVCMMTRFVSWCAVAVAMTFLSLVLPLLRLACRVVGVVSAEVRCSRSVLSSRPRLVNGIVPIDATHLVDDSSVMEHA